jgi:hypothetical protein
LRMACTAGGTNSSSTCKDSSLAISTSMYICSTWPPGYNVYRRRYIQQQPQHQPACT